MFNLFKKARPLNLPHIEPNPLDFPDNTLEDLFYFLVQGISLSHSPHSVIFLLKRDTVLGVAQLSSKSPMAIARNVKLSEGIIGGVVKGKKSVFVPRLRGNLNLNYYVKNPGVTAVVAVPVIVRSEVVAVLIADFLEGVRESVRGALEMYAKVAAKFMEESRKFHQSSRIRNEYEIFYEMSRKLNECGELSEIFNVFIEHTRLIARFDDCLAVYHEEKSNRVIYIMGKHQELSGKSYEFDPEEDLVSWIIKNRVPLYYESFNPAKHHIELITFSHRFFYRIKSLLLIPLSVGRSAIGCVLFIRYDDGGFSEDARRVLEVVCAETALRINNTKMYLDMKEMATTDSLTGLSNHRIFQEALDKLFERVNRYPEPISIILLDIDHFKQVNDTYGHPVGDQILQGVGGILSKLTRKIDIPARIGGEEFGVILSVTNAKGARLLAERIHREIRETIFETDAGNLSITISIGIATYPDDAMTKKRLVQMADKALYGAKKGGRDRVVVHGEMA